MALNLILGPMFSGKSTELLRRYRRYTIAKKKCLLVKAACDTRYDIDRLCTHDGVGGDAVKCSTIKELLTLINPSDYDVICIDEIQFITDAAEELDHLVNKYNLIIETSGLSGNYLREPFEIISRLQSKADHITVLNAVCMLCGKDNAPFTFRTCSEKNETFVGGKESYMALCRSCYITHNKHNNQ